MVSLATSRLILRECSIDDLSALYEIDSDFEVVRYVSYGPLTLEECRRELTSHIDQQSISPRPVYYLAVVLRSEDRLIGRCVLDIISDKHREGKLGYALNRHYWGRGYVTEAARALLIFGFATLNLHRIVATCSPDNSASEHVLQKLGMQKEGYLRENKFRRGTWRDSLLYAALSHESI